jgi:hypothetical protein
MAREKTAKKKALKRQAKQAVKTAELVRVVVLTLREMDREQLEAQVVD